MDSVNVVSLCLLVCLSMPGNVGLLSAHTWIYVNIGNVQITPKLNTHYPAWQVYVYVEHV